MNRSRRTFLQQGSHLSLWAATLAAQRVWAQPDPALPTVPHPRFDTDPFSLGIASGQPRPHSVILWTRLTHSPQQPEGELPHALLPVTWQIAEDEAFSVRLRSGTVWADPAQGHSVRVWVQNLTPGRVYFYRFISGGAISPVGRTRTAPAPEAPVQRLRLALASCQHYEQGWFLAHRDIAAQDFDLVLFVGDYIYDSTNRRYRVRAHETAERPRTLEQFRARYATYKRDPDLQAAHAAHPWLLCWDDHEVRNDYAGIFGGDSELTPEQFLQVRTAAYQAYFEHQPLAPDQLPVLTGPSASMRMHDQYRWGQLADLWTLDGRQHRSLHACNPPQVAGGHLRWRCASMSDPEHTMLGTAQEGWLHQGLRQSTAQWRLIGQATQISPWGVDMPGKGRVVYSDGWDGYPAARERMLQRIAQDQLSNVVFLGGDVHRHVVAQLRPQPNQADSPVVASEFVTSSVTTAGMPDSALSLIRRSNPDILHARSDERGYMAFDITPQSLHCVARAASFPVLPHSTLTTQASFRVESGHPTPIKE